MKQNSLHDVRQDNDTAPPPVSTVEQNRLLLRDHPIGDLVQSQSFTATVFLLYEGRLPNRAEESMLQAMLVSLVDHGLVTPAIEASQAVHRGGNPLHVIVGAGMLAFGEAHGGDIDAAALLFRDAVERPGSPEAVAKEIVGLHAGRKATVPGYGHKLHTVDPRTVALMKKARELDLYGRHCAIAEAIERVLEDRYQERMPLNVGGAAAAIVCELGCDWRVARALYILSRTTGTIAHTLDELRAPDVDEPTEPGTH